MVTEILSLEEMTSAQANKYVTLNRDLRQLEAMTVRVLSRTNGGPPASPTAGATYIIDVATGAWASSAVNRIAHYSLGIWRFYPVIEGLRVWVNDENIVVVYNGTSWIAQASGDTGISDLTNASVPFVLDEKLVEDVNFNYNSTTDTLSTPNLSLSGNATIGGTLGVTGVTTLSSQLLAAPGTLAVPGISFSTDTDTGFYSPTGGAVDIVSNGVGIIRYDNTGMFMLAGGIKALDGSAADPSYTFSSDQDTGIFRVGNNIFGFTTNGIERVRIDTTGLKVGGGAALGPLHVANTLGDCNFFFESGNASLGQLIFYDGAVAGKISYRHATDAMEFSTVNTLWMTLSSVGNLGIGLTPTTYKLEVSTDASFNSIRVGRGAGNISTNTVVGSNALPVNTTGNFNVAIGVNALQSNTTGIFNMALGGQALRFNTSGQYNTGLGLNAGLQCTTGSYNTLVGAQAGRVLTTGSGNIIVSPHTSAGAESPVFLLTTQNDRVVMGHTAITNAYVQVAWTVVSDARDKTEFAEVPHGLDFVSKLNPTAYRFKTSRDSDEAHGPVRYGFKAQDILELEGDNNVLVDTEDQDKLKFNESSLVAVLTKAIQELNDKVKLLEQKLN